MLARGVTLLRSEHVTCSRVAPLLCKARAVAEMATELGLAQESLRFIDPPPTPTPTPTPTQVRSSVSKQLLQEAAALTDSLSGTLCMNAPTPDPGGNTVLARTSALGVGVHSVVQTLPLPLPLTRRRPEHGATQDGA